jgi:hypothetical protein
MDAMLRRVLVWLFVATAVLVACGRQVTPNPPESIGGNSILPGYMLVRFRTAGPMNFNSYRYVIVFNTTGNGQEPYANAFQTGFQNYSYAWIIGAQGGIVSNPPGLIQYYLLPGTTSGLGQQTVVVPPELAQLTTNTDGGNTTFQLLFARTLFNQPNPTSPSPAPTRTPGPSPSSGATAMPAPLATTPAQAKWNVNFFTTDTNGIPIDALGPNGKNDNSFSLVIDTSQFTDCTDQCFKTAGAPNVADPAAQIAGGEIINSP